MTQAKKCTAIKALLLLALLGGAALAQAAQVAATVVQLSGPLLDKKADGTVKVLAIKSEIESGDTLVTEKNTYAMLKFIDNGEITLKPGTSMKIDNFAYEADKPDGDSASFSLLKGGLRSVTGLLGKRNKEKFAMKTPTATIGIRGTTFIAELVPESEAALASRLAYHLASTAGLDNSAMPIQPLMLAQGPAPLPGMAPGLYVQVLDGVINLTNSGGTQNFAAGQFGFTPSFQAPPVIVPTNPGIQFQPPPVFNATTGSGGSSASKSSNVDCVVR